MPCSGAHKDRSVRLILVAVMVVFASIFAASTVLLLGQALH